MTQDAVAARLHEEALARTAQLRDGLQAIIDAADRLSTLDMADQFREGYVVAFRDARAMALEALV